MTGEGLKRPSLVRFGGLSFMAKVKTYRSPKLGLIINAEPEVKRIEFVNGEFKTDDPKQQEYLEKHRGFGLWIFCDDEPVAAEKPVAKKGKKAEAVDFAGVDLNI